MTVALIKKLVLLLLVPAFFADVAPGGCCGSTAKPVDRDQYEQTEDKKGPAEGEPQNTSLIHQLIR